MIKKPVMFGCKTGLALILAGACLFFNPTLAQAAIDCASTTVDGVTTIEGNNGCAAIGLFSSVMVFDTVYGVDYNSVSLDGTTVENDGSIVLNNTIVALTVNAGETLVYGGSITLGTGASIALATGAVIKKGAIWATDADADGWRSTARTEVSATRPGTKVRLFSIAQRFIVDQDDAVPCPVNGQVPPTGQTTCRYCDEGMPLLVANGQVPVNPAQCPTTECSANKCAILTLPGKCDGAGSCQAYTSSANVLVSYVCEAGVQQPPNATYNTGVGYACSANSCSGYRYYYGCLGGNPTTSWFSTATAYSPACTVFTGTNDNTVSGPCSGSTFCNGSGTCNYASINCPY